MKLKFQATLDQAFPAYVGVFGDLYSKTSLKFLQENPTPTKVIQLGMEGVAEVIQDMNRRSAVQCGLRRSTNKLLREYYDRKRLEGKAHKVAIIVCANKLLHIVFALLSRNEEYHDDQSVAA